ncbi:hypothetical protein EIP91_008660, partial [Steccherinum ochraceum]
MILRQRRQKGSQHSNARVQNDPNIAKMTAQLRGIYIDCQYPVQLKLKLISVLWSPSELVSSWISNCMSIRYFALRLKYSRKMNAFYSHIVALGCLSGHGPVDIGMANILACHVNLFLGTLSPHAQRSPHLRPIIERALKGEFFGNFLLSEVGHGLDIVNIETTATKVKDGFMLNTPHPRAAKIMPPTTPVAGFPKMAIVIARLIVDDEDRGIHPFLVHTSDDNGMCAGITSMRLPSRVGSSPLDFAITTFNQVYLPSVAFLGVSFDKPHDLRLLLHQYLWRIGLGTALIAFPAVNALGLVATIGGDYSCRRHVQGKGREEIPIISFRTQQLPILQAVAAAHILRAWQPAIIEVIMDRNQDSRAKHGMGVVFKATVARTVVVLAGKVGERMGAQGLFPHNLISQLEEDIRGVAIAEGDILVLSIRLFSELLLNRYSLPQPTRSRSLLSRHSASIFAEYSSVLKSLPMGHQDPKYNNLILPHSETALISVGHAHAHSAALDAGVPQPLLEIFELFAMHQDEAWYVEHAGMTKARRHELEDRAVQAALPHLKDYLDALDFRKYYHVPIQSDQAWDTW